MMDDEDNQDYLYGDDDTNWGVGASAIIVLLASLGLLQMVGEGLSRNATSIAVLSIFALVGLLYGKDL